MTRMFNNYEKTNEVSCYTVHYLIVDTDPAVRKTFKSFA